MRSTVYSGSFASGLSVLFVRRFEESECMLGKGRVSQGWVHISYNRSVLFCCDLAEACAIRSIKIVSHMPSWFFMAVCSCMLMMWKGPRQRDMNLFYASKERREASEFMVTVNF